MKELDDEPCPTCGDSGEEDCPEMCGGDIECEVCGGDGVVDCTECS